MRRYADERRETLVPKQMVGPTLPFISDVGQSWYIITALDRYNRTTVPVSQYILNIIFPLLGVRADMLQCISFDRLSALVLSVMLSTSSADGGTGA